MRLAVRTLAELGAGLVLAPERHIVHASMTSGEGSVALGELVRERVERVTVDEATRALVLDTTHAREGVLDVASARAATDAAKSAKKRAYPGDVIVSRLRPYLRQVALVHPRALAKGDDVIAVSTEFYVLAPVREGEALGWLVPWLLSEEVQRALASAQEGGHHPRVPRASLFALRAPASVVRARKKTSRDLDGALVAYYGAAAGLRRVLLR